MVNVVVVQSVVKLLIGITNKKLLTYLLTYVIYKRVNILIIFVLLHKLSTFCHYLENTFTLGKNATA